MRKKPPPRAIYPFIRLFRKYTPDFNAPPARLDSLGSCQPTLNKHAQSSADFRLVLVPPEEVGNISSAQPLRRSQRGQNRVGRGIA